VQVPDMKNKHKHILSTFCLLALLIIISSCNRTITRNTTEPWEYRDSIYKAATVINYALDGCTWMIRLEDGKKLQPSNLKPEFQKDKLKVWIKYTIKKGGVGICMAGEMVDITEIELRKNE
jgi:hypothetical protein